MQKISFGLLVSVGLLMSFGLASTSGTSLSLSEQITVNKNNLETQLTQMETKFQSEYERLIAPEKLTANYQSLVCLGIIKDDALMQDMENKLAILKKNMLQDYVKINAEIFNLLNQYSVGLIDETTYATQYEKLLLDANSFFSNHQTLISKADQEYLQKIFIFLEDNKKYAESNTDLLKSLNTKILKIQTSLEQFRTLEAGIFEINNALNLHQGNFLDTLEVARNSVVSMLDKELDTQITRYNRRYTNDSELKTLYLAQKHETLNGFSMALDNEIANILGSRYDPDQYTYAKEQIGVIRSTFYQGDTMKCEKVLTTSVDLGGYIDDVEATVKNLSSNVQHALVTLSNTGSTSDPKTELLGSFKRFYTTHYTTEVETFKNFVRTRTSSTAQTSTSAPVATTVVTLAVTEVLPDYVFDRPFEKGENSIGVKYLQTLLKKLGFYTYTINSTFDANTAEAVYKFQIAKGILKGVAGETAQGFVGPSTRSALNGEMKNQAAIAPVAAPVPTTIPEVITTPEVTPTIATNPFLGLLNKMEAKYSSKDAFVALMYKARANVVLKAADETISVKQKMVLETIKEAVDLYLNENQ